MTPIQDHKQDIVSLLVRKLELKGMTAEVMLLQSATTDIVEEEYDNWNGGQYYYTLYVDIPLKLFVEVEDRLEAIEKRILKELTSLRRGSGNEHISSVTIRSAPESAPLTSHLIADSGSNEAPSFWEPHLFRVFISHVATHKLQARELKVQFKKFGITSFVAHEDIEPTKEWLDEIQTALSSMDAIVALLTPDFIQSKWCDQEVGIAMGLGRLVVPIRMGSDPYGFLGKYQGMSSQGKTLEQVANEVFSILARHDMTRLKVATAVVEQVHAAESFASSKRLAGLLERLPVVSADQARRLRQAIADNYQVSSSFGVSERIESLLKRHGHTKTT